jgi:hypothetical protein
MSGCQVRNQVSTSRHKRSSTPQGRRPVGWAIRKKGRLKASEICMVADLKARAVRGQRDNPQHEASLPVDFDQRDKIPWRRIEVGR